MIYREELRDETNDGKIHLLQQHYYKSILALKDMTPGSEVTKKEFSSF